MLRFKTLQSRIILFFLGLFTVVQALAFYAVYSVTMRNAHAGISSDLAEGIRVIDLKFKSRSERLLSAAQVLSRDFSLKSVYGSGDRLTLQSVLKGHASQIQADLMLVVSLQGMIVADTAHPSSKPTPFPYPAALTEQISAETAPTILSLDGNLYQLAVVPLRAPLPVAWIIAGFRIDDALARDLKAVPTLDVTFLRQGTDGMPIVEASSLAGDLRHPLSEALRSAVAAADGTIAFDLHDEMHLGRAKDFGGQPGARLQVFLQHSMADALQPFYRLRKILILLFVGGVAVTLALGVVVSSVVTKPVRELVEGARIMEQGDYTHPLPVARLDEIGDLTSAFNRLQTAIAERESRIKHQAYHDTVTDLPNRAFLQITLKDAIVPAQAEGWPIALIMMNVNRFSNVVATLGYETGNSLLQKLGIQLRAAVPNASMVARMGGDVFAVMIRGEEVTGAINIVKRIVAELEAPFWVADAPVRIEARFGIAVYPLHGEDADLLLRRAEIALHLAKASPQGFAIYSPDRDRHSIRHLVLLAELRHAIDRNELSMYYQPKIHFASRRITGVEALIRWRHSQHGFIPPDEFITLSEGTGLIKPVTHWALRAAMAHCAMLNERGINLNMAVNLSARVLPDNQLPDLIASMLDEYGIAPLQMTLEITESAIMTDVERTLDVITRLASLGVRLCVDDFGTGYSSFAYLKILPIDELKIDKTFVLNMDQNENDAMIVGSIIELGHNLRFKVTAEGVESQGIWEMLSARGCDVSQGYLHGKPMMIEELIDWSEKSPWGLLGGKAHGATV